MTDALLIYPKLGSMDSLVLDIPLSIIYAATDSVKKGYDIELIDLRTEGKDWQGVLGGYLKDAPLLAGVSVMTGSPLKNAREISRFIKSKNPQTHIVWGGPHATVLPETINEPYIDFLIRGYGSASLAELITRLKDSRGLNDIAGLSYKQNGQTIHNPRSHTFEIIRYQDIPYRLIDINHPKYARSYNSTKMFPVFTSIGCPYRCSFCVHPTIYKEINGPKWIPYEEDDILGHIEYLVKEFGARHIVFIDDTSFSDIERMRSLFKKIVGRKMQLTFEFRGARINEIDKMDGEFLELLAKAGGRMMMVGVESGSNRVLESLQKGITKEQILRVNRKLAKYPYLIASYNFLYGSPGETYADLLETKDLVLMLLKENPGAYFGWGSDWKPTPGTRTLEIAEKEYGYRGPKTLDDWIQVDSFDVERKIVYPWYTKKHNNLIKLMQISSFVVDDKLIKESAANKSKLFKILRLASRIYKPIATFRLRFNITQCMVEYQVWRWLVRLLRSYKANC